MEDCTKILGKPHTHSNGIVYTPILLTNMDSENENYPPTVVYIGKNGKMWSRSLKSWYKKFTLI